MLFKKKAALTEAVQFTGANFKEVLDFCPVADRFFNQPTAPDSIGVKNGSGLLEAVVGDWIIKGVAEGDWYTSREADFPHYYEPADAPPPAQMDFLDGYQHIGYAQPQNGDRVVFIREYAGVYKNGKVYIHGEAHTPVFWKPEEPMMDYVVGKAALDLNPELAEEGIGEGDAIRIPVQEDTIQPMSWMAYQEKLHRDLDGYDGPKVDRGDDEPKKFMEAPAASGDELDRLIKGVHRSELSGGFEGILASRKEVAPIDPGADLTMEDVDQLLKSRVEAEKKIFHEPESGAWIDAETRRMEQQVMLDAAAMVLSGTPTGLLAGDGAKKDLSEKKVDLSEKKTAPKAKKKTAPKEK